MARMARMARSIVEAREPQAMIMTRTYRRTSARRRIRTTVARNALGETMAIRTQGMIVEVIERTMTTK